MIVTIDKSGRVLIPKPVRDRLGLAPGTTIDLHVCDSSDGAPTLELRPKLAGVGLVQDGPLLVHHGRPDGGGYDVVVLLREARNARAQRIAGFGGAPKEGAPDPT